jgi:hypothetical protein
MPIIFGFDEADRFHISGRGDVSAGACPPAIAGLWPKDVIGSTVGIGGQKYRVAGVETFLQPRPLKAGDAIGLLLADLGTA